MTIRELVTKIGFNVEDEKLDAVDKRVKSLKTGLIGLTALVGTTSIALVGLVRTAANSATGLNDLSVSIGVGVRELQELGYAATLSGADVQTMADGLRNLSKNIVEASKNPTSDLAKRFNQLGIRVTDLNGRIKSSDVVFREISENFHKIDGDAERVNFTMATLGKSGTKLIQTLDRGTAGLDKFAAELHSTGAALTPEQIQRLGDFNDEWSRFSALLGGFRNSLAAEIAPALTEVVVMLREWFKANSEIIKQKFLSILKAFVWYLKMITTVILRLTSMFLSFSKILVGTEFIMKALLTVMSLIFGGLMLAGVIKLTVAFMGLAKAVLIALSPFLLVAAKIMLIGGLIALVIEDIYSFFKGDDSVLGWVINGIGAGIDWLQDKLVKFTKWFGSVMKGPIQWISKMGVGFGAGLNSMLGINSKPNSNPTGITPQTRPTGISGGSNQNVRVDAPITVTVPAGTNPAMVGEKVESGVQGGIGEIFDRTNRATSPAMGY